MKAFLENIAKSKWSYGIALALTLFTALYLRLTVFSDEGGDHIIYKRAVLEFSRGINPYEYTFFSYGIDDVDRGYAYFPTLLYIMTTFWKFNVLTQADIATAILWKIPILLADLGVAWFLLRHFRRKKHPWLGLASAAFWLLNPYFIVRHEYSLLDPIQVFFLFAALNSLGKNAYKTGFLYALAVSTKLIPAILFPIFLWKTRHKVKFLSVGALVFLLLSAPFLTNLQDAYYYLQGTLLVHGERNIQGRPLLSFLTFFLQNWGITLYQERFPGIFSKLALVAGPLVSLALLARNRLTDKYILTALSFLLYFLLTPVFNRTHVLWSLPFFLIALYEVFRGRKLQLYASWGILYGALFFYLLLWTKGLKPPTKEHPYIWMDDQKSMRFEWPLMDFAKNKFYEYRGKYYRFTGQT